MSNKGTEIVLDVKKIDNNITFGTVVVNYIVDPFNPVQSKQSYTDLHGRSLDTYLKGYALGAKYLVSVNGKLFEGNFEDYIVKPLDNITYVNQVSGGGGGKQILSLVAMVALTVATFGAGTAFAGIAGSSMFGLAAGGAGMFAIAMGTYIAGALLISYILAPEAGGGFTNNAPEIESKTYNWTGISTSRDLNGAIPVLYGTHALGGTVINSRFYYKGSDDWLATQIALCHGEVEQIDAEDIQIQETPFSSFVGNPVGTDAYFSYTPGTFNQAIMSGFSDSSYTNASITRKLNKAEVFYFISESTNIDFFRLHFEFPKGLYHMNKKGNKSTRTVEVSAKYRVVGSPTWNTLYNATPIYRTEYKYTINGVVTWSTVKNLNGRKVEATRQIITGYTVLQNLTFSSSSSTVLKKYFEPCNSEGYPITLPPGQIEFEVTRLTNDDSDTDVYNVSDCHVRFLEEINSTDINYGGIAMLGINMKATDKLSNQRPNFITTVTRKPLYLAGAYRDSSNPAWICYDILTNINYGMGLSPAKINKTEFERWALFCDGQLNNTFTLNKPAWELNAINTINGMLVIPETELPEDELLTLAGINRNLSTLNAIGRTIVNGVYVDREMSIYNVTKISRVYESNNVNRADGYYYYVSFTYPLKLGTSIMYEIVHRTRETELTPKLRFNGVFDSTSDVWTSIQEVAKIGRGQVILQGTKFSCIFDSKKTVSGLYNGTNSNNVTVSYLSQADVATEVEVQFADKKINYEMTTVSIQDADAMASGKRTNKTSVMAKGITSEAEALVYGRYLLASSKYIRRVISFDADIESITQTVGDLIAVQTDVTQYGKGGMIQSVIGSLVILDDVVYLEQGIDYTLKIKRKNDDFIKDYTFNTGMITPLELTTFNDFPETPAGVIKIDDISLVVYQINVNGTSGSTISTNTLVVAEGYEISPEDRYSFGIKGSDSLLCVITDISRDGDLTRRITAAEYNESILDFDYDNDILQRIEPTVRPRNTLSKLTISDRLVKQESGTTVAMMSLSWDSKVASTYNLYIMEEDFKNYLVMGIKGNRYEYAAVELAPEVKYRIYLEDAQDTGVFTYKDYTITSFSSIPEPITAVNITTDGDNFLFEIDYPNQPLDFSHYEVYLDGKMIGKQLGSEFAIPAKIGKLTYPFSIRPVDMINKKGPFIYKTYNSTKPGITNVTYTQEKEYIKFNITPTDSSFDIDYFEITYPGHIGSTKENTYTVISNWVGTRTFTFRAYDIYGNTNGSYTLNVTVSTPAVKNLTALIEGKDCILRWDSPDTGLPIDYFEIEYDSHIYKTKSNQYRVPVYWGGSKLFNVRCVNTLGAISNNVTTEVLISNPKMLNLQTEVIDNNVLLRWSAEPGSLPIDVFMLYKGADANNLIEIGEKKGTFTTVFENTSGIYTYWMAPIDSAGNIGTKLSATTTVNQPPDYILNTDWYSKFTGTKVNAVSDGNTLVLPINTSENISQHFDTRSWVSAQAQVNAGYPIWIEPFSNSGSYTEVFDYGAVLASSMITLNIDKHILKGTPTITNTISISPDGVTYTDYVDQLQVFGTGFRYVKVKIAVTGVSSAVSLNTINVRLDSKLRNDGGTGYSAVPITTTSITGSGSIGTAVFAAQPIAPYSVGQRIVITGATPTAWNGTYKVLTCSTTNVTFSHTNTVAATVQGVIDSGGTTVRFNNAFTDITNIQITPIGTTPMIGIYDFQDVPNPTSFKVLLYNNSGARVNGSFSWTVRGY